MCAYTMRVPEADVDPQFIERWSPRAFSSRPVPDDILKSLFEAARWAPSCNNEQPWLFLYANTRDDLQLFRQLLTDGNRVWADKAPVLAFAIVRKNFKRNNRTNAWAAFDTGAAWISLALQAGKHGLYAHAMAGIHKEKVYQELNVPENNYEVICAIAIGYYGNPSNLPEDIAEREKPTPRKPLAEVAHRGKFPEA